MLHTIFSVLQSQRNQALLYCTFPLWPEKKNPVYLYESMLAKPHYRDYTMMLGIEYETFTYSHMVPVFRGSFDPHNHRAT